jgi:hypothetical protein
VQSTVDLILEIKRITTSLTYTFGDQSVYRMDVMI